MFSDDRPIIACSTSTASNAAVGVVRLSGISSFDRLSDISNLSSPFKFRYAYFTDLLGTNKNVIDSILLILFKAPYSFTGENLIEFHLHGNLLHIENVISYLKAVFGARDALPGEFSFRAHKNKKLSLHQIEGLDLFLNAQTPIALAEGASLLHGELFHQYGEIYSLFVQLKTSFEVLMDFSDDVGEEQSWKLVRDSLAEFQTKLASLAERARLYSPQLLNPTVVIFGAPNAGKSTLFNILLSKDRSIVSKEAGTTRDYVSEIVRLDGVNFNFVDTAGLRETDNSIEKEGIRRTSLLMDHAFFKIHLVNATESVPPESINSDLTLITHSDLETLSLPSGIPVSLISESGPIGPSSIRNIVFSDVLCKYNKLSSGQPLLLERHRETILSIYNAVCHISTLMSHDSDLLVIDFHLKELDHNFSEFFGITDSNHYLDNLFTNFCIGK